MSQPKAVLTINTEWNGPYLWIRQYCSVCDIRISERAVDTSRIPLAQAEEFGTRAREEDGDAWLAHVARFHTEEKDS